MAGKMDNTEAGETLRIISGVAVTMTEEEVVATDGNAEAEVEAGEGIGGTEVPGVAEIFVGTTGIDF